MIQAKTIVTNAQIYRNGVEVTRSGSVELSQGDHVLQISSLPAGTVPDTARLYFPSSISCSNIRFAAGSQNTDAQGIEDEIAAIKDQIEILGIQADLIKSNGVFKDASGQNIAQINEYIDSLPSRLGAIYNDIAKKNKEVKALEEKLQEESKKQSLPSCIVDLHCDQAGTYPFELHAHDNNASWTPVYEIHSDAKKPLEIRLRARISQWTQEDWKQVPVSLCSGNPSLDNTLPVLKPMYITYKAEQPMPVFGSSAGNGMMMAMAAMPMQRSAEMQRVQTPAAETSEEETMTEYILQGTRDIPSGNEGTMADLQIYEIPASYHVSAVPLMSGKAYLVASTKVKDLPQISGNKASVFLNNVFLGQVDIRIDYSKDDYALSLGPDERIRLSRKMLKKQNSTSLLKGQKTTAYTYEITVANNKNIATEIVVNDQIPVPQDKTILVEVESMDGAERNEETGILTWRLSLNPHETKKVSFSFKVSCPKDKTIVNTRSPMERICPSCGAMASGKFCPECGSVIG